MNSKLALKTLFFFLIWLLLSESFDWLHVSMGLVVAFAVAWFNTGGSFSQFAVPGPRTAGYFIWLVGRILQSGFHLSMLILHPSLPINPKMIRHRTSLRQDTKIVLLGNSVTLTPGTITVEANSQELLVHAMDDEAAEDLTNMRFDEQIGGLTGRKGSE